MNTLETVLNDVDHETVWDSPLVTNITFEWASVTDRTYDLLYKTSADTPNIFSDMTAPPANTCNLSPIPTGGVYTIQVSP